MRIALLLIGLGCALGLGGCGKSKPSLRVVRVDLERAKRLLPDWQGVEVLEQQHRWLLLAEQKSDVAPSGFRARLPEVALPPPVDRLEKRRGIALQAVQNQREAARERLLEVASQHLRVLEGEWRQELTAAFQKELLPDELQTRLQTIQRECGERLFPLRVRQAFLKPEQPEHAQLVQQIKQIEEECAQAEERVRQQWQDHVAQVQQEIESALAARRRAYQRSLEEEIAQTLKTLPEEVPLLPKALTPYPAKPSTLVLKPPSVPPASWSTLQQDVLQQEAAWKKGIAQSLQELLDGWARRMRYRLTNEPKAPDKTEQFVRWAAN